MEKKWINFKTSFQKDYQHPKEENFRKKIFLKELKKVSEHNYKYSLGNVTWKAGLNKFSDWTSEEFFKLVPVLDQRQLKLGLNNFKRYTLKKNHGQSDNGSKEIDWVEKGAVTEVKDQQNCGSCYSFSVITAIEGQLILEQTKSISLSAQAPVDCSQEYGNLGCNGGNPIFVYNFISDEGIPAEKDYPYQAKEMPCNLNNTQIVTKISDVIWLHNEEEIVDAIEEVGPLSNCLSVSENFKRYKSGIFDDTDCDTIQPNHCTNIVGIGTENGQDYYKIKNSWGTGWGEQGYIKMKRGIDQCLLESYVTYPVL